VSIAFQTPKMDPNIMPYGRVKVIYGYGLIALLRQPAVFELRSKEEAAAAAVEFMQLHKDLLPGRQHNLLRRRATAAPDAAMST
jgi:hypothetical protein